VTLAWTAWVRNSLTVDVPHNLLLRALPREDFERLLPCLRPVTLRPGRLLHPARTHVEHLYFIETGLIAAMAKAGDGKSVAVWLIGREGVSGLPLILCQDTSTYSRLTIVGGSALRIQADHLRSALQESSSLRVLLFRHVFAVLMQTSQASACNLTHSLRQRFARWVLLAHDRCKTDELLITHELLSRLLGVRRASVTECVGWFERNGMIRRGRGVVQIKDRARLEELSCDCYRLIRKEQEKVFRGFHLVDLPQSRCCHAQGRRPMAK
jgi:CRP-like cAMP-binding protein